MAIGFISGSFLRDYSSYLNSENDFAQSGTIEVFVEFFVFSFVLLWFWDFSNI